MNTAPLDEYLLDPVSGSSFNVLAGESLMLEYRLDNRFEKPIEFGLEVQGLPLSWLPKEASKAVVRPFGEGKIALRISLNPTARAADYPFSVQVLCEGEPLEGEDRRQYTMFVHAVEVPEPIDVPTPIPVVEIPTVVPEPPAKPPAAEPSKKTQTIETPTVNVSVEKESVGDAPVTDAKTVDQPTGPTVIDYGPEDADAPTPIQPIKPGARAKKAAAPKTPPPPPPEEESPVVDYGFEEIPEVEQIIPEDDFSGLIVNLRCPEPRANDIISLRPGETALVTFSFKNEQKVGPQRAKSFVLQEDRQLDTDWIEMKRDVINVSPNGTGTLAVLLKPPINAAPGDYLFVLRTGAQGLAPNPVPLILRVTPTAAVLLRAKTASAKIWSALTSASFDLSVASDGNADTAYRLVLIDPDQTKDERTGIAPPKYDAPGWNFELDTELGNIQTPGAGIAAAPNTHKLTFRRSGIWWFGFQETQKVRVHGIPVTDEFNGKKSGNEVDFTLTRRRWLPLHLFLAIPIFFVLVLLLGGTPTLKIDKTLADSDDHQFVLGSPDAPDKVSVPISVEAPWYSRVSLNGQVKYPDGHSDDHDPKQPTDEVSLPKDYFADVTYFARGLGSWRHEERTVTVVPIKTKHSLQIYANGSLVSPQSAERLNGLDSPVVEVQLPKNPGGERTLEFLNLEPTDAITRIYVWQIHKKTDDIIENQTFPVSVEAGRKKTQPIKFKEEGDKRDAWFVTSDGTCTIIHVRLVDGTSPVAKSVPTPEPIRKPPTPPAPRPIPSVSVRPVWNKKGDTSRAAILVALHGVADGTYPGVKFNFESTKMFQIADNGWGYLEADLVSADDVRKSLGQKIYALAHSNGSSWSITKWGPGIEKETAKGLGAPAALFERHG